MTGLYFLITLLSIVILLFVAAFGAFRRKNVRIPLGLLALVVVTYVLLWGLFFVNSGEHQVEFGSDLCFDDWCATVTGAERPESLGDAVPAGQYVVLHVKMSNHARGIAQKPSEPRIHILDAQGRIWSPSPEGQLALEKLIGKQNPLDSRLELHQSLETQIVFDVPMDAGVLKAQLEEGPPLITMLILPSDRDLFVLP